MDNKTTRDRAKRLRRKILQLGLDTENVHIATALSPVEIMISIFDKMEKEDRFILSKGHACLVLYAMLQEKGLNPKLGGHPDIEIDQGIECTTGSLGHGLPIGIGMALAKKIKKERGHIYILMGDGECQEGSIWEALMIANHHKLDNFTVIIDYNGYQAMDKTKNILDLGNLKDKFESFGIRTMDVFDGHSVEDISEALDYIKRFRAPNALIIYTIKGKGISFMENVAKWHACMPTESELKQAWKELE